jgi:hypothetical protein
MRAAVLFLSVSCAALGCGSQAASGTLNMAASAEEAAVEGYPTTTGLRFADGWSIDFDFLLISLDDFYVSHGGTRTPLETDEVVVNLHDAIAQDVWSFPSLPAQRYEDVGYEILPPAASARHVGTVSQAQVDAMVASGTSFWVHGTAHHPMHHDVVIDLQFPLHTEQTLCMNAMDMTEGLVVTPNGTSNLQMTFHLDHLFFDSIVAPEPSLRFEAYAAAAGSDFVVTWNDLASQPLADLHDIDGTPLVEAGAQVVYDPGSTPLATQDLRSFVFHQVTTIGHFNGEGHCTYVCLDASGATEPSCRAPRAP